MVAGMLSRSVGMGLLISVMLFVPQAFSSSVQLLTHEKIVYVRGNSTAQHDPFDIWIMNDDGSNPQRLTTAQTDEDNHTPRFASDGTKLAFGSFRDNTQDKLPEIYTADLQMDGNGMYQLGNVVRRTTDVNSDDWPGSWSPTCDKVVFSSNWNTNQPDYELYFLDLSDNSVSAMTDNTVEDYAPAWNRNTNEIAFLRAQHWGQVGEIWVRDLGTGNERQLTKNLGFLGEPSWGPTNRILFSRVESDRIRIYEMDSVDGNNDQQGDHLNPVTDTPAGMSDGNPSYSPSGGKIAFARMPAFNQVVNADIWIRDVQNNNEHNITNTIDKNEIDPVWKWNGSCPALKKTPPPLPQIRMQPGTTASRMFMKSK